jgi:enoyl-CoA hydratase/carnithine racemase
MKVTKKAIRAAKGLDFDTALNKVEGMYLKELMETKDAHEGLEAFMNKRKPEWKHK